MLAEKQSIHHSPWRHRALVIAGAGVIAGILSVAWQHRPTSRTIIRSASSMCQRDYHDARTAADSAAIDARVWVVDKGWRRTPSCLELRTAERQ